MRAGGRESRPATAGWEGDSGSVYSYVNQLRKRHAKASFEFMSSGVTVVPVAPYGVWDIRASI